MPCSFFQSCYSNDNFHRGLTSSSFKILIYFMFYLVNLWIYRESLFIRHQLSHSARNLSMFRFVQFFLFWFYYLYHSIKQATYPTNFPRWISYQSITFYLVFFSVAVELISSYFGSLHYVISLFALISLSFCTSSSLLNILAIAHSLLNFSHDLSIFILINFCHISCYNISTIPKYLLHCIHLQFPS